MPAGDRTRQASGGDCAGRRLALAGWACGAAFFFYAWVLRVAPSVMVDELMRDFAAGGALVGQLSALYFYGYAGMQIPAGLMLDRFGPRRLMSAAALIGALGTAVFAASDSLAVAGAGRFLLGGGAAFSLVGAMAVAGQWFPARRFALFSGLAMMAGMAGGVFGQAPLRLAIETWGWRDSLGAVAAIGVLVAAACFALVRDRERGAGGVATAARGLVQVLRNRQTWLNAGAGLGATGPLLAFAGLWGVPFLEVRYGLARTEAAALTSLALIGWGVGAPTAGWLSDRLGRRREPLIAGMTLCLGALATLVYLPGVPVAGAGALCLLVGLGGSAQIVNFALVREHNPAHLSGTAIGIVNAFVTGAGALFQPSIGWLLDRLWSGQLAGGARIYSVADYRSAFVLVIGGLVGGLLCAFALRDRAADR